MPEEDKEVEKPQDQKSKEVVEATDYQEEEHVEVFDFGGLPTDTPFKRNIGCGG